jgi:hypothetical protein
MLKEAVSAQEFADFDLQELTELLQKTSRGRFGQEKAIQIQEQAAIHRGGFLADAPCRWRCAACWPRSTLLEEQQEEVEKAQES